MDTSTPKPAKKVLVFTPEQIAKLGLTSKLQSVIAPQLQNSKTPDASKKPKKDKTPKGTPKPKKEVASTSKNIKTSTPKLINKSKESVDTSSQKPIKQYFSKKYIPTIPIPQPQIEVGEKPIISNIKERLKLIIQKNAALVASPPPLTNPSLHANKTLTLTPQNATKISAKMLKTQKTSIEGLPLNKSNSNEAIDPQTRIIWPTKLNETPQIINTNTVIKKINFSRAGVSSFVKSPSKLVQSESVHFSTVDVNKRLSSNKKIKVKYPSDAKKSLNISSQKIPETIPPIQVLASVNETKQINVDESKEIINFNEESVNTIKQEDTAIQSTPNICDKSVKIISNISIKPATKSMHPKNIFNNSINVSTNSIDNVDSISDAKPSNKTENSEILKTKSNIRMPFKKVAPKLMARKSRITNSDVSKELLHPDIAEVIVKRESLIPANDTISSGAILNDIIIEDTNIKQELESQANADKQDDALTCVPVEAKIEENIQEVIGRNTHEMQVAVVENIVTKDYENKISQRRSTRSLSKEGVPIKVISTKNKLENVATIKDQFAEEIAAHEKSISEYNKQINTTETINCIDKQQDLVKEIKIQEPKTISQEQINTIDNSHFDKVATKTYNSNQIDKHGIVDGPKVQPTNPISAIDINTEKITDMIPRKTKSEIIVNADDIGEENLDTPRSCQSLNNVDSQLKFDNEAAVKDRINLDQIKVPKQIHEQRDLVDETKQINDQRDIVDKAKQIDEERDKVDEIAQIDEERNKGDDAKQIDEERDVVNKTTQIDEERDKVDDAKQIDEERDIVDETTQIDEERNKFDDAKQVDEERDIGFEAKQIGEQYYIAKQINDERDIVNEAKQIDEERDLVDKAKQIGERDKANIIYEERDIVYEAKQIDEKRDIVEEAKQIGKRDQAKIIYEERDIVYEANQIDEEHDIVDQAKQIGERDQVKRIYEECDIVYEAKQIDEERDIVVEAKQIDEQHDIVVEAKQIFEQRDKAKQIDKVRDVVDEAKTIFEERIIVDEVKKIDEELDIMDEAKQIDEQRDEAMKIDEERHIVDKVKKIDEERDMVEKAKQISEQRDEVNKIDKERVKANKIDEGRNIVDEAKQIGEQRDEAKKIDEERHILDKVKKIDEERVKAKKIDEGRNIVDEAKQIDEKLDIVEQIGKQHDKVEEVNQIDKERDIVDEAKQTDEQRVIVDEPKQIDDQRNIVVEKKVPARRGRKPKILIDKTTTKINADIATIIEENSDAKSCQSLNIIKVESQVDTNIKIDPTVNDNIELDKIEVLPRTRGRKSIISIDAPKSAILDTKKKRGRSVKKAMDTSIIEENLDASLKVESTLDIPDLIEIDEVVGITIKRRSQPLRSIDIEVAPINQEKIEDEVKKIPQKRGRKPKGFVKVEDTPIVVEELDRRGQKRKELPEVEVTTPVGRKRIKRCVSSSDDESDDFEVDEEKSEGDDEDYDHSMTLRRSTRGLKRKKRMDNAIPPKKRRVNSNKGRPRSRKQFSACKSVIIDHLDKIKVDDNVTPTSSNEFAEFTIARRGRRKNNEAPIPQFKPEPAIFKYVSKVTCAVCKQEIDAKNWTHHKLRYHNDLAWRIGEPALNLDDADQVSYILNNIYKRRKPLHCEKCGCQKKSVLGYLSHKLQCQKTPAEIEALKVTCEICGSRIMPSSYNEHIRVHKNKKIEEEEFVKGVAQNEADRLAYKNEGGRKRKAASRATDLIQNITNDLDEDTKAKFKPNDYYEMNYFKKSIYMRNVFKKQIDKLGYSLCRIDDCDYRSYTITDSEKHHESCDKRPENCFVCKLCITIFQTEEDAFNHVTSQHNKNVEGIKEWDTYKSGSSSSEESSGNDSERVKPIIDRSTLRNPVIPFLNSASGKLYNLDFMYNPSISKEISRHLNSTNFYMTIKFCQDNYNQETLFKQFAFNQAPLNTTQIYNYLPKVKESIPIKHKYVTTTTFNEPSNLNDFKRYKLFESEVNEHNTSTIFCGGPILSLVWAPTPYNVQECDQILAISTKQDPDKPILKSVHYTNKNLIQFWNYGPLNHEDDSLVVPKLEFCLAHNHGDVICMEWCPSGCYNQTQLGLLAVTSSDGYVYGYSICQPNQITAKVFEAIPCFRLQMEKFFDFSLGNIGYKSTVLSWSKRSGHSYISVGYSNGVVAIYDLNTKSKSLIRPKDNGSVVVFPYLVFQAHFLHVTGVVLSHLANGKRLLATTSHDRFIKFWDLEDISKPITANKRLHVNNFIWLNNWISTIDAQDDCTTSTKVTYPTSVTHLRDFGAKASTTLFYSNTSVNSVSGSDWSNIVVQGNNSGELLACVFPHLLPFNREFKNTKFYCGYTRLADFRSNNKKLDFTPKSMDYKHIYDNYGLVLCDFELNDYNKILKLSENITTSKVSSYQSVQCNMYPVQSITKTAINPNRFSFLFIASGYQIGLVRVLHPKCFTNKKCKRMFQHWL